MAIREINFDGIVGPSHNYAGLSLGNLASSRNAGETSLSARGGAPGAGQDALEHRARPGPGPVRAAAAPGGALARRRSAPDFGEADRCIAANAMSASAMWAANAATVSPAPDTADGKCHLTVANLKTMPHRSLEWPDTLGAVAGWRSRRRRSRSTARCPTAFGDEGAANHMRLAGGHGEPGVEMFVYGVAGGPFPARQHIEASRAVARLHRLDPNGRFSPQQSEEAIAAGAFHNDVVAVANERVLFAHEKAFADRGDSGRLVRGAGARISILSRSPTPTCRWPTRSDPICSTRNW